MDPLHDDLPDEFDAIVIGTGLPNAMVAAALARVGRRVLHLDGMALYGGSWSSVTLAELEGLTPQAFEQCAEEGVQPMEGELLDRCTSMLPPFTPGAGAGAPGQG